MKIESFNFGVDNVDRFVEKRNRNEPFVRFGLDNMEIERWYVYTDFSPIHHGCIQSIVNNAAGRGLTENFRINSKEKINDVLKQAFFEFAVTGNLFLEIIWKKDRSEGISGFHIIPAKYMRAGQPEDAELYSDTWYYCHDWMNWRKAGVGIIEFKEFDPNNFTDRQIVHIKNYQPGYIFYGVPDYLSAMLDIRLSRAISQFNLSQISNGASPSLFIHFNAEPPDSQNEQENLLARLEERYTGSENAGRIIVSWGSDSKPEITQITPSIQQGGFAEIFALVRENILAAHQIVDGSIIGLPSPTGFNSSAEQLETTYKLFMNTTVKPMQDFVLGQLQDVVQLMYPKEQINLVIEQNQPL
jgi:phage portal protein BeeE